VVFVLRYYRGMKKAPIYGAAALAASVPFAMETEEAACKDRKCVKELVATQPEQPHAHQEAPEYKEATEMVVIPSSPIYTVPRNSPEHRQWIDEYGEQGARAIEDFTNLFLQDEQ